MNGSILYCSMVFSDLSGGLDSMSFISFEEEDLTIEKAA